MISSEFKEKLFARMQEHATSDFDSEEIEMLCKFMSSDIMLKAFGRAFTYCNLARNEMVQLDMSQKESQHKYSQGQGRIVGVHEVITGLLDLITEKEEIEDDES